jgi:isoleucyl-tRNA synthetase
MYYILQALTRWLAPILSFTAEEIWQHIPGWKGQSIFLETWFEQWPLVNSMSLNKWEKLQLLRDDVNKALELKRQQGVIGSGLAASVRLYVDDDSMTWLAPLSAELKFFFITSDCVLLPADTKVDSCHQATDMNIWIEVEPQQEEKCERCWHRHISVGQSSTHPNLCIRCEENITGHDEQRAYV